MVPSHIGWFRDRTSAQVPLRCKERWRSLRKVAYIYTNVTAAERGSGVDAAEATLALREHALPARCFAERDHARHDSGWHALEVEDNGIGLPPGLGPAATGTPALQPVHPPIWQFQGWTKPLRPERGPLSAASSASRSTRNASDR